MLHICLSTVSFLGQHLCTFNIQKKKKSIQKSEFTSGFPYILCIVFNICEGKQLSPKAAKAQHCNTIRGESWAASLAMNWRWLTLGPQTKCVCLYDMTIFNKRKKKIFLPIIQCHNLEIGLYFTLGQTLNWMTLIIGAHLETMLTLRFFCLAVTKSDWKSSIHLFIVDRHVSRIICPVSREVLILTSS